MRLALRLRSVTALALVTATLGLLPLPAAAESADVESPFAYAFVFVSSVSYAHLAESYYDDLKASWTLEYVMALQLATALAEARLSEAATLVAPFMDSRTERIRSSARVAHATYLAFGQIDRQRFEETAQAATAYARATSPELLRQPVDDALQRLDHAEQVLTEFLKRLVALAAERHEAWLALSQAALGATDALVLLPEKDNEEVSRLVITDQQRRSLLRHLEQLFGPTVKKYVEEDRRAAPAPAVLIHKFLSQPWKSSEK
jgi:hypothetical protein